MATSSKKTKYRFENASVVNVVDGDTIDVYIDMGFRIATKQRFRLNRINAPESRTTDKKEKERGLKAKAYLNAMLEGQSVVIETEKAGKYGRWLADVYTLDEKGKQIAVSVNDEMVSSGHAIYKRY